MTEKKAKEQNRFLLLTAASILVAWPGLYLAAVIGGAGTPVGLFACLLAMYPLWALISGALAGWLIPGRRCFPWIPPAAMVLGLAIVSHAMMLPFLGLGVLYFLICLGSRALTLWLIKQAHKGAGQNKK